MSQWSSLAPFGEFTFNSAPTECEKLYLAQQNSMGPAFAGVAADAETYADAMCFSVARRQIQAAGAQDDPLQVNYLIDAIEKDWRVYPSPESTLDDRRAELAFVQGLANGALDSAITAGLSALLGPLFVNWRPMDRATYDEVSVSSTYPVHSPLRRTPIKKIRIDEVIIPGARTVAYTRLLDDGNPILPGEELVVEPGRNGLEDVVTIAASTPTTLTATFAYTHDAGTPATTGPMIRWTSNQRHSLVIVDTSVLTNSYLLNKIHEFMRRTMPAVSTWIVCAEMKTVYPAAPGHPFPGGQPTGIVTSFRIGESPIGQAPIGASARTTGYDLAKAKSLPLQNLAGDDAYVVMPLTESGLNYGIAGGSLAISGAPTFTADGLSFDGVDDFAWIDSIGDPTVIVFRAKFPANSGGTAYPCVFGSSSSSTSPAGGITFNRDTTWRLMTNTTEVYSDGAADDQWHTFSMTFDGVNRKFYIDGTLVHTSTFIPSSNGTIIKLGGGGSSGAKQPIIIRNLVTYQDSALSDANRLKLEQWATLDDIRVEDP
jgi:hypothetical protein